MNYENLKEVFSEWKRKNSKDWVKSKWAKAEHGQSLFSKNSEWSKMFIQLREHANFIIKYEEGPLLLISFGRRKGKRKH